MAEQWQEHNRGIWYASLTRGDAVATVWRSGWDCVAGKYHYHWDAGDGAAVFAGGTADSIDAAKRAAEAALKELTP